MVVLGAVGAVLVVTGAAMLVAPAPVRAVLRVALGVRIPAHQLGRVAAWGLVAIGLVVLLLVRLTG